ncbi:MAG: hypothetical protein AAGJ83_12900, partial [Planctomycetota bacterium]
MITFKRPSRSHCRIIGLGTATPPHEVTQPDALAMSREIICEHPKHRRILDMMFRKSGVNRRQTVVPYQVAYQWKSSSDPSGRGPSTGDRMLLYQEHAPRLAQAASEAAFGIADDTAIAASPTTRHSITPDQVTHLVTVSCTGFAAPGLDWFLQESLGLPRSVQRVQVGFMGCQGMINAFRVARGLAAAEPDAVILICAVELCSLHYRLTWHEDAMIGNALFADGAAAALVVGTEPAETHERFDPILI